MRRNRRLERRARQSPEGVRLGEDLVEVLADQSLKALTEGLRDIGPIVADAPHCIRDETRQVFVHLSQDVRLRHCSAREQQGGRYLQSLQLHAQLDDVTCVHAFALSYAAACCRPRSGRSDRALRRAPCRRPPRMSCATGASGRRLMSRRALS